MYWFSVVCRTTNPSLWVGMSTKNQGIKLVVLKQLIVRKVSFGRKIVFLPCFVDAKVTGPRTLHHTGPFES